MTEQQYYWHFCQVDEHGTPRLGYGDNREVKVGETLGVHVKPVLCAKGLHASAKLWDALGYASGELVLLLVGYFVIWRKHGTDLLRGR